MFHVCTLKKYVLDGSPNMHHEQLDIQPDLSYEEEAMWILNWFVKSLCRKEVPLVKVLWLHQGVQEDMWECEDEMLQRFPRLFPADNGDLSY